FFQPIDETLVLNVFCGVLSGVFSSCIANPTDVLKGVSLTAQRAAIVVGVELPVYDITKKHLIMSGLMGDTVYTHFLSSFTCGLAGALASNPVDVVRTRMMNQRTLCEGPSYKGTMDCLLQTWKNEGFFALYKGFWPNWLRLGPWNIINPLFGDLTPMPPPEKKSLLHNSTLKCVVYISKSKTFFFLSFGQSRDGLER
ncbi:hypothetical protein AB205_0008440, partial [Aquarana catesbeiana]